MADNLKGKNAKNSGFAPQPLRKSMTEQISGKMQVDTVGELLVPFVTGKYREPMQRKL